MSRFWQRRCLFPLSRRVEGNMRNSILVIAVFFVVGIGFFFRLLFLERKEASPAA